MDIKLHHHDRSHKLVPVRFLRFLGPGLITGAADDDPSGIATYSQAGAQFGYSMLWVEILALPAMIAIQSISARIGRVTGGGIIANLRNYYPAWLTKTIVALLLIANITNIAADIAAMGEAVRLVFGGPTHVYAFLAGLISVLLQVFVPYRRYAPVLKWLTLVLFVYVGAAFTVKIPWGEVVSAALLPHLPLARDALLMVVALLGTAISPYLFFWQSAQEVEEMQLHHHMKALRDQNHSGDLQLRRITMDTAFGMTLSSAVAFFIIVTTAATLHANGITDIQTSAQAAEALRPLAGELTFLLFSIGIIGTGMLAVPALAGSAAYGVSEAMGWPATLEAKPQDAKGFYGIISLATLIGMAIGLTSLDPIKLLFWAAVVNGIVAVPIMVLMVIITTNPEVMGRFCLKPWLKIGGWLATFLMALVVFALAAFSVF